MALKRVHDNTYAVYAQTLLEHDKRARPWLLLSFLLLSLAYGTGVISLTVYAIPIGAMVTFHIFTHYRSMFYQKIDRKRRLEHDDEKT
jgi:hypothetical protein